MNIYYNLGDHFHQHIRVSSVVQTLNKNNKNSYLIYNNDRQEYEIIPESKLISKEMYQKHQSLIDKEDELSKLHQEIQNLRNELKV